MRRTFVLVMLTAAPTLVSAEGWLLMQPPTLARGVERPMREWMQMRAFDSAEACEAHREAEVDRWSKMLKIPGSSQTEKQFAATSVLYTASRCLPASQVPLP